MYPKRKTYLPGHSFQCRRTLRGPSIEDIPTMRASIREQFPFALVLERADDFIVDGKIVGKPSKHKEVWDILECTHSGYFKFDGGRVSYKQISSYDPDKGEFYTGEAIYTLYPLPA